MSSSLPILVLTRSVYVSAAAVMGVHAGTEPSSCSW